MYSMKTSFRHCLRYETSLKTISRLRSTTIRLPIFDEIKVKNEPILSYEDGSKERQQLLEKLNAYNSKVTEIPIVINGKRLTNNEEKYQVSPFDHKHKLAKYWFASEQQFKEAIENSQQVRLDWERMNINQKTTIFLRAADLMAGKYRQDLNATTMLGQGKTVIQAEVDSAAELIDFLRFNVLFLEQLYKYQPLSPAPKVSKNSYRYRGLEGFVASISPFNFTAIGGNLASAPILMGNVVIWKPAGTALLSNWLIFKILEEAGVPPGVLNFMPSSGPTFNKNVLTSEHLAAVNFTGSVGTFRNICRTVADNLDRNHGFPRLVGECGGKDYHFVHESANVQSVVNNTIRSAFEYSGQKCSACSRLYVPQNIWPEIRDGLLSIRSVLKLGSPLEFDTFTSAVIDKSAFDNISHYIHEAQTQKAVYTLLGGGKTNETVGYYIEPTIIESKDPNSRLMREEIFGPVLTVYVYDQNDVEEALNLCDKTGGFALTGSIFAEDKQFLDFAAEKLKFSAGNFYINDKCTGAVVAQQPFGGGRLSGTNDKAGAPNYLLRWCTPQTIKETFVPLRDWKYPYMKTK